ncbi:unnamed protein product [Cyclocybe aegerita]|uniref:Uncharacterized protein n=1 Tax=Cyclocybe aegerita TaxID=1973307 RepID=A0A8S0WG74_CYCAE|nr:unnamed protein product [Cyclocybe aegerita]
MLLLTPPSQHLHWRWTYHILIIWTFTEFIALILLVPETFVPALRKEKAENLRKFSGNQRYWAPLEREVKDIAESIAISCLKPFELLIYDRMALLLDIWTSVVLGILYLSFQAFPYIFGRVHGFNMQETGMTFLGIGVGMLMAIFTQHLFNLMYHRAAAENKGIIPPETRLVMGEIGGILVPLSLYWIAFTTYQSVPWIVPIIASIPFGAGIYYVFTSTFTYLVTAYRPIAASAMAANSAMRSSFAAAFPLFVGAMYDKLGTAGATALLAGITTLLAPLPFIFRRIGARLRQKSRFAEH